jgi:Zn-dependent protease
VFGIGADAIFRIPALLIALTVHEYAHARTATSFGDPTPRIAGRVTLNPIPHLDPIGLLMLWLAGFGWAKPVPINPYNFRNGKTGVIIVSLAGVAANFVTAIVCAILFHVLLRLNLATYEVQWILMETIKYNLILTVFNLIPIPPLDGSQVVSALLPGRQAYAYESIERYGTFILMALVFTGIIGGILGPMVRVLAHIIDLIVALIF